MASASELLVCEDVRRADTAEPVHVPKSWRLKTCLCTMTVVVAGLFVFGLFAGVKCGNNSNSITGVKIGDTLHVISPVERLIKVQENELSTCDSACQALAGQRVTVTVVFYISVGVKSDDGTQAVLKNDAFVELVNLCNDDWKVAGIVSASMSGSFLVVFAPLLACVLHATNKHFKIVRDYTDNHPEDVYRMTLSGAAAQHHAKITWGPGGAKRALTWFGFPWMELGAPLPLYICIAVIPEAREVLIIVTLSVVGTSILIRSARHLYVVTLYYIRTSQKRTSEIGFCRVRTEAVHIILCIFFDGMTQKFYNIGDIRADRPAPVIDLLQFTALGFTQLVAHHADPHDDESPIVAWSFRVLGGHHTQDSWSARADLFPVDMACAHDFHRWLSQEPYRSHLRYRGDALTRDQIIPETREALFDVFRRVAPQDQPLQDDDEEVGVALTGPLSSQGQIVVTARCQHAEAPGHFQVTLTSMAGKDVAVLIIHGKDTVADLLNMCAAWPEFLGRKVNVVLANGEILANLCPTIRVESVFQHKALGSDAVV